MIPVWINDYIAKKVKNSRTRYIVFGIPVLLVVLLLVKFMNKPKMQTVDLDSIAEYKIDVTTGVTIRPTFSEYLSTRKAGVLERLDVTVGQRVEPNQILAVIDAALHEAKLRRALSNLQLAQTELRRSRSLFASRASTKQDLDKAINEEASARSELEEARKSLVDAVIRAPQGGVVGAIAFKVGDHVPVGSRLVLLEDRSKYVLRTKLPGYSKQTLPESIEGKVLIVGTDKFDLKLKLAPDLQAMSSSFYDDGIDVMAEIEGSVVSLQKGFDETKSVVEAQLQFTARTLNDVYKIPSSMLQTNSEVNQPAKINEQNFKIHALPSLSNKPEWVEVVVEHKEGLFAYVRPKKQIVLAKLVRDL